MLAVKLQLTPLPGHLFYPSLMSAPTLCLCALSPWGELSRRPLQPLPGDGALAQCGLEESARSHCSVQVPFVAVVVVGLVLRLGLGLAQ